MRASAVAIGPSTGTATLIKGNEAPQIAPSATRRTRSALRNAGYFFFSSASSFFFLARPQA
jgi:hypothetical protein